ncbi:MAG: hypothetical protein CML46_01495, partial [Rhodobacteraceae bacterium]|nr:hypothetical protein [Paracoccaceae bacterium]
MKLTASRADYAEDGFSIASAIDGDEETGWGVAPKLGVSHFAVFGTEEPLDASSDQPLELRFVLSQQRGKR